MQKILTEQLSYIFNSSTGEKIPRCQYKGFRDDPKEEDELLHCQFCNLGYLDSDYYSHMALGHLR